MQELPHKPLPSLPEPSHWSTSEPERAIETYLEPLRPWLGRDLQGYRNHCMRVYGSMQGLVHGPMPDCVVPALVFHDLALWTHATFDYLDPSVDLALQHLEHTDRMDWAGEVRDMIQWHHKLRPYSGPHADTVEPFRRADMGDLTLGLQGGIPSQIRRSGRQLYPNCGFHKMLLRRTFRRLGTKPWSPAPMLRW